MEILYKPFRLTAKKKAKRKKRHQKKQKINALKQLKEKTIEISNYASLIQKLKLDVISSNISNLTLVKELCKIEMVDQESFWIVDINTIVKQYKQWTNLLPRVQPFYAVKCNSDEKILATLKCCGSRFDCASKKEIELVMKVGANPKTDIIFANPCKQISQIKFARKVGVSMVTADSESELFKLRDHWPEVGVVLRIEVDDSKSVCRFNSKFGASLNTVKTLIKVCKDLELNLVGVSFHVGSGCFDASSYSKAVSDAKKVFMWAKEDGFNLKILDIGGGFPGSDSSKVSFKEIADTIRDLINDNFSEDVSVIAEPGRYFAEPSHIIVCNVFSKKENPNPSKDEPRFRYYINDGLYGSFNCIFFDHAKVVIHPVENTNRKKYISTIFGPTCDSLDKVADCIKIQELEIGDWVYVENFGAYTRAAASNFNGFKTNKCYYIWKL